MKVCFLKVVNLGTCVCTNLVDQGFYTPTTNWFGVGRCYAQQALVSLAGHPV